MTVDDVMASMKRYESAIKDFVVAGRAPPNDGDHRRQDRKGAHETPTRKRHVQMQGESCERPSRVKRRRLFVSRERQEATA